MWSYHEVAGVFFFAPYSRFFKGGILTETGLASRPALIEKRTKSALRLVPLPGEGSESVPDEVSTRPPSLKNGKITK